MVIEYSIAFVSSVFPELSYDALGKPRGMDVCISTTAETDKEAHRLLALMGMPFREGAVGQSAVMRKKKLRAHHFDSKAKQRIQQRLFLGVDVGVVWEGGSLAPRACGKARGG
ncbi:60S ribosomal protein L5 [Datura stramonium]|uniref:60S ribosomal protein L5 n=1 Tax=Datura stramonium TaxID=4076 RepID=A0ABS8SPW3_DATST|nr:60S ribosomal protein L5 [Datura stramonium]